MPIRPLTAADKAAWAPLWQGYLTFYNAALPSDLHDITFARLTGGTEPMGGFLALDDAGRAIGLVHWLTHRTTWSAKLTCYLQDLFVSPDVRGGGHGRALIEAVHAKAREMDCTRVYWLTQEGNATARALYEKLAVNSGFIVYRQEIG
jgi:GNAT superfamily N-acetyltransferase